VSRRRGAPSRQCRRSLYHLKDPLHLIELAARRADALYLWTHLVTDEATPPSDPRRHLFAPTVETHLFHDVTVRAYRRTYGHAAENVCFCGGMIDEHRWLHRDDLLGA
jgi:hypothetical protein